MYWRHEPNSSPRPECPAFAIPTLVFPLMFYVFFGVVMSFSPTAPTYLLATYCVFGLMGPSLFGFGVGFANERDSGALLLKQTTPMPVTAYLLARVAAALVFGMAVVVGLFLLAAYAADVKLYRWQWFALAGVALSSVIPFCTVGLAIGAWVKAQSAVAIVNLVYLPMAFLSGLWIPIAMLPSFVKDLAIIFPAYHQAQLAAEGDQHGRGWVCRGPCADHRHLHDGVSCHRGSRVPPRQPALRNGGDRSGANRSHAPWRIWLRCSRCSSACWRRFPSRRPR